MFADFRGVSEMRQRLYLFLAIFILTAAMLQADDYALSKDLYDKGLEYRKDGRREEALEMFEGAVQSSPNSGFYRGYLGWVYQDLGRPGDALKQLDEALKLGYIRTYVYASRIHALEALGRFEEAAEACLDAVASSLKDAELLKTQGMEEAALQKRQDAEFYRARRVGLLFKTGQIESALNEYPDVWNNRGGQNVSYIVNIITDGLYAEGMAAFRNERFDHAAGIFSRLERCIEDEPDRGEAFPESFYRIPLSRVSRELAGTPLPPLQVKVRFLCIIPFGHESEQYNVEAVRETRQEFNLFIRHLSFGNIALEFDEIFFEEWSMPNTSSFSTADASIRTLETGLTMEAIAEQLHRMGRQLDGYDSLIYYWDYYQAENGRPNAHTFRPADFGLNAGGRESMGILALPAYFYSTSAGVYVHEYFHLVERRAGITPSHGFSPDRIYTENKRIHFPEWKGLGQYDYYLFHFNTTIRESGFTKLLHE